MRNKILLTIAIIFLVLAIGLFYVNKVLLPVQVKGMVVQALEKQLGRKVTLGTLQWGPVKGAAITDLTIYSQDNPEEVFLHIESASAQILFLPVINKKMIIPSVSVNNLSLRLVKINKDTWNFSDLIKPSSGEGQTTTPDIIVSGFSLTNGRVRLVDLSSGPESSEIIEPINIKGSLSLAAGLHVAGDITLPATEGTITFNTRTGLRDKTFKGDFKLTNIFPMRYLGFSPVKPPIQINGGSIRAAALTVFVENEMTTVSGDIEIPGLDMNAPGEIRLRSDLTLNKAFITQKGQTITLEGELLSGKTWLGIGAATTLEGDLKSNITKLTIDKDRILFDGGLIGPNLQVALDATRSLKGNLRINNANVSLAGKDIQVTADVELREFLAYLSPDQSISGTIDLPRLAFSQNENGLKASSDVQAKDLALALAPGQKMFCQLTLTKAFLEMKPDVILLQADIAARDLKTDLSGITVTGDLTAVQTHFELREKTSHIVIKPALRNAQVDLPQNMVFTGTPSGALEITSSPNALEYQGTIEIPDGKITGAPVVGKIHDIKGTLTLLTDQITTKDLSFTALNTPITVSGEIRDLKDPLINLEATANNVDLALAEKLAPDLMKQQALKVSGQADVSVRLRSLVKAIDPAKIQASAVLRNVSVDSATLKRSAKNISGSLTYADPTLSWKDLSLDTEGQTFSTDGYLQDFVNPFVSASIKGQDMNADIQLQKSGNTIRLQSVKAALFDSSVTASGKIILEPGTPLMIDILADGKVALADLAKVLPKEQVAQLDQLKIAGTLKVSGTVKGDPLDWQHLTSDVSIQTPLLSVMGYKIEDLSVTAKERDGALDPLEIHGTFYGGELNVFSAIKIADNKLPFDATYKLNGTNIELLKRETPLKEQQLSGTLHVAGAMKGTVVNWKDMTGKTTVEIKNGYLWDVAILSNILSILSTSSQGGDAAIREASATLSFGEGRISTNNLTLKSALVTLLGEGWIDYDQHVDMNVTPELVPAAGSTETMNTINPTSGLINIRVTGTLQKPKIEHNIAAPTLIKKTLENTVGGLLKLFE